LKRLLSFWLFSRVLNFPRKKKKVNSRRKTLAKSERVFAAKSAGNRAFSPRPEEKNQQQIAKQNRKKKINESRREVVKFYSMGARKALLKYIILRPHPHIT
jgi:hypothetical protein